MSKFGFHPDFAALLLDDFLADRETNPAARVFLASMQTFENDEDNLGMLGSRRKVALTAKVLREWGIADGDIERVHAPVGLSIGADTPEEIAVSVVAEMISVRRAGSRRRGGVEIHAGDSHGGDTAREH